VVGGSSEIAEAVLSALARRGLAAVLLCGRDEASMRAVGRRLVASGVARVEVTRCDVQDIASLAPLADEAARRLGSVDLLLVAAGALGPAGLDGIRPAELERVVACNFTGPAASMVAFVPMLREQGRGRIVVLSSVAGVRVRRANFAYGSAKAGLDAFSQGLADALTGTGVEVLIVRPGYVHGRMTAGRRAQPFAVRPADVGEAVAAAIERGAAVVWVPPSLRVLFALARLVPRRAWRRLER
jgi:decaprenylphospho-beta-D-erythro-pentofuranosid-2-ulose 2-reductase